MSFSDVQSPQDLKKLSLAELREYAEDLRQQILTTCLTNGGHLGASLGAVELAISLHYVFDSPSDSLIWDVGHQAYAHKLITGRAEQFNTLRKKDGISGFLSRKESEHDAFGAGHSSTSLSAGLAIAWANGRPLPKAFEKTKNDSKNTPWSVAVIGDGAITAGLSFESLNNTRAKPIGPYLIILNDNQMSISANVGAMPTILTGDHAKTFFELFGFDYIGPTDGHDLSTLIGTLEHLRDNPPANPVVLHVLTQKGKGYAPAEEHPENYHGVSPIAAAKVADLPAPPKQKSYSDTFGEALCKIAETDPRVVAITAAMPEGTGLVEFSRRFPDRFFDVGIAEPHAVTFAAGLASKGYRPTVAIYSTFMQRALDSVIHDVALQGLGVTFAIDRAGLVGADGPTHHGVFDLAYFGMIPEMKISSPSVLSDTEKLLREALAQEGPAMVRYPRGSGPVSTIDAEDGMRWHSKSEAAKLIILAFGPTATRFPKVISKQVTLISTTQAKPFSKTLMDYLNANAESDLITLEDGAILGGFGERLYAELDSRPIKPTFLGYADHFVPHGTPSELEELEQVSAKVLDKMIAEKLNQKSP